MASFNFTTGPAPLPDIGILFYNGCTFGPLVETSVAGVVVRDNAGRTTKLMEYTIEVDGYVTIPDNLSDKADGQASISTQMVQLRQLLTAQGGVLKYTGRGNDISVNVVGGTVKDAAWGPIPEVLDFQPLGAGRSAKIKWRVKTRIYDAKFFNTSVLQFNSETSVSYDDAGYSQLSIRGTLEIPLTRATQTTRTVPYTVDNFREAWLDQVANSIDLTRFRVTKRDFNISRDKRTMEWDFAAEELPPMGLPKGIPVARGNFSVRPAKSGMGLVQWLCTMRVTYTVQKNWARRTAWFAFLALLRVRMEQSARGWVPPGNGNQNPGPVGALAAVLPVLVGGALGAVQAFQGVLNAQKANVKKAKKSFLIDLSVDEGLYLDSRTVTFSATWRLNTVFSEILLASGLWKKVSSDGGQAWAMSMRSIMGWKSWDENILDPTQDTIVDFGGF